MIKYGVIQHICIDFLNWKAQFHIILCRPFSVKMEKQVQTRLNITQLITRNSKILSLVNPVIPH